MMQRSVFDCSTAGLGLLGALAVATGPGAAQTTPAPMPSFTTAQAKLGQRVYAQSCQGCQGEKRQGGQAPALVGKKFLAEWADGKRPVADLHGYIAKNMPRNRPGSLTTAQALNVTAYVLSKNGYKAGSRALTATTLKVPLRAPVRQAQ